MSFLSEPVLVLNKFWMPLGTVSAKRAIKLIASDKGVVVDPDTYRMYSFEDWVNKCQSEQGKGQELERPVKSVSFSFELPEVIVVDTKRVRELKVRFNRQYLYMRDKFTCVYCKGKRTRERLSIDHVVPKSKGGATSWENCVTACRPCNFKKSDQDPKHFTNKIGFKPKAPKWYSVVKKKDSWSKFIKT